MERIQYVLDNIVRQRKKLGYSQETMADLLPNITQSNYGRIENGQTKLTVERLFQIADVLEVPPSKFVGMPMDREKHLLEHNIEQSEMITSLNKEIKELNNKLKNARGIYRGYYLLVLRLFKVFIHKRIRDKKDNEITLDDLNKIWLEFKEDYPQKPEEYMKYIFNNPEGFGFDQYSIPETLEVARRVVQPYVQNVLNKNPDLFGFNDSVIND